MKTELMGELQEIDKQADIRELGSDEWNRRYYLESQMEKIYEEELYWRQRIGKFWLQAGDANTKFFHQFANGRRRKGTIVQLETEQGLISEFQDIMNHVVIYYKNLFGPVEPRSISMSSNFLSENRKVKEGDKRALTLPFSEREIMKAMMEMKKDAAPSPNGFGAIFFHKFWDLIKGRYLAMFGDFYKGDLDIRRLNYGAITLVPKVLDANTIKQYRPICLLNVDYKGFTRVLTERLTPVAREVIGENQTGFIKGRNILEGVIILHEVFHELSRSKGKGMILKIDFEKAYDRVRWDFLEEVMRGKEFPEKWINWVMQTVKGGQVCVNINGTRGPYFKTMRGLRQGDPLSPLLFNLVADSLSVLMEKAVDKNLITGVLGSIIEKGISHIQYADDTVLMTDGSDKSIVNLKILLYCFEWMSGLKINFHKSEVVFFGYSQADQERKANMLNCKLGTLPMKYLGIPVSDSILGLGAFQGVTNRMIKRLDPWKGKFMISGGKLILTNTCLSNLPMYVMGFYMLPKGTHVKMDSIRSKFFWQGAGDAFKYHMAKWVSISKPKAYGGLGILNTYLMNQCPITNWIWKLEKGSYELWFRLLKAKYMKKGGFFSSKSQGSSQFWKGLHKVKHLFRWGA